MNNLNKFFYLFFLIFSMFAAPVIAQNRAPDVKIRVAQYEKRLEFTLPAGGRWLSFNRSGPIPAAVKCKIAGKLTTPAVKKYHLMVGSAPAHDEKKKKELIEKFTKLGFKTHKFTLGRPAGETLPGNQIVFVGVGIFFAEEEAQKQLDELSAKNISSWIFTETIEPAKGSLQLFIGKKAVPANFTDLQLEGKKGVELLKVEFAKGYSWHGFADRTYKSRIQVRFGSEDSLDCIEHTNLESLLVGIVPSEISAKAPAAALQAQAIAARGEMLSKMGTRHFNQGYDFCSEQHCQVYKGMQSCDDHIFNSIKNTWGILLLNHENRALDAVYSANCGGHSSANQNIWTSNADPHLQGVSDLIKQKPLDLTDEEQVKDYILNPPNCWCGVQGVEGSGKFRWTQKLSAKDWKKVEKQIDVGAIESIDSFVRDVSGRIISLKIKGEQGEKTIMKELTIRRLFAGLRSSCFIVDWQRNKNGKINAAIFQGAGWGHGVGMCQTGAQSMAYKGKTFAEILLHYYTGAQLKKLY